MINIILANVGTIVCFRTGNPADEQALLQMFTPYIEQGEIANLPTFNYYIRIAAVGSQEPLSGETVLRDEKRYPQSDTAHDRVIDHSRRTHARKYIEPVDEKAVKTQPTKPSRKIKSTKQNTTAPVVRLKLPGDE